jgi:short-subunit dehydrogenase
VTGGSSGIGLSLCRKLAAQGLSIVMAAMPDAALARAAAELRAAYPAVEVRAVGVDLSAAEPGAYLAALAAATADIPVQLLFLNAGYVVTGFFAHTPLPRWLANQACNQTAVVALAHVYAGRLLAGALAAAAPAEIAAREEAAAEAAMAAAVAEAAEEADEEEADDMVADDEVEGEVAARAGSLVGELMGSMR